MRFRVEVISREIIKPSSKTPDIFRHYRLSFLDQISPPIYNSLILFFPAGYDGQSNSARLKRSLSDVLTLFYPLAGRIKDNIFVHCNDDGVLFVEAEVKCLVQDVIQNPIPSELRKLLPLQVNDSRADTLPLGIQLNTFGCGGVGVSICLSHKLGDALSFLTFTKAWAALASGKSFTSPEFVSAKLFPPRNILGYEPGIRVTDEELVTKRFLFNASVTEQIRARYSNGNINPSRIEALSAFIWSRFAAANKLKQKADERLYSIVHVVNLRPRLEPPLPEHSFGNLYRITMTIPKLTDEDGRDLVSKIKDSIRRVDEKYVEKLRDGQDHLEFIRESSKSVIRGEMVSFSFTSLCRFPLYEADFGWGRPLWVCPGSLGFKNLVVFMDSVTGDGIEAWINLGQEDMARFVTDPEFAAFVANKSC